MPSRSSNHNDLSDEEGPATHAMPVAQKPTASFSRSYRIAVIPLVLAYVMEYLGEQGVLPFLKPSSLIQQGTTFLKPHFYYLGQRLVFVVEILEEIYRRINLHALLHPIFSLMYSVGELIFSPAWQAVKGYLHDMAAKGLFQSFALVALVFGALFLLLSGELLLTKYRVTHRPSFLLRAVQGHLEFVFEWVGGFLVFLSSFYYVVAEYFHIEDLGPALVRIVAPTVNIALSWIYIGIGYAKTLNATTRTGHRYLRIFGSLTIICVFAYYVASVWFK